MQFSAIRTAAALRFRDTGNAVVTDTQWKTYVNLAYNDVLRQLPYASWLEASATVTIAAATRSGDMGADVRRLTAVYNTTDDLVMHPLQGLESAFEEYPEQTETGTPQYYRLRDNDLYIYPLPEASTTFTVEYLKQPADLSLDADLPAFPAAYHEMLVSGAVARAYRDDGNGNMAQAFDGEYAVSLQALKTEAGQPRIPQYLEIQDNWE